MTFSFHPAARRELNEAVDYYEDCQPGLGYEFLEEVYATIARILHYPNRGSSYTRIAVRGTGSIAWTMKGEQNKAAAPDREIAALRSAISGR